MSTGEVNGTALREGGYAFVQLREAAKTEVYCGVAGKVWHKMVRWEDAGCVEIERLRNTIFAQVKEWVQR